jgi:multidrug transporter EmrE-like cation transporter
MLLAGAGLVIKSLGRLLEVNPGFRAENVLTLRVNLPSAKYGDPIKARAFFDQVLARAGALPGVESIGVVSDLPMSGNISTFGFQIEGRPAPVGEMIYTDVQTATASYFHAMKIPLLVIFCAVLGVSGNVALRYGMEGLTQREGQPMVVAVLIRLCTTPVLWLGLAAYGLSMIGWLQVISAVPLSQVYPIFISISFMLLQTTAFVFLHEPVRWTHVVGSALIANAAGSVLFVVGSGSTNRSDAQVALERLASVQVHVVGVVINKARPDSASAYHYERSFSEHTA